MIIIYVNFYIPIDTTTIYTANKQITTTTLPPAATPHKTELIRSKRQQHELYVEHKYQHIEVSITAILCMTDTECVVNIRNHLTRNNLLQETCL